MCGEELWADEMLNVKCQNVSEKHSEPTREMISNSVVSVSPNTHLPRQTIVFLVLTNVLLLLCESYFC